MSLVAGAADTLEQTQAVASDLGFPVAFGVTQTDADLIGAWWDGKRGYIQPSEFLLTQKGRVLSSTYSSSPIGRVIPKRCCVSCE